MSRLAINVFVLKMARPTLWPVHRRNTIPNSEVVIEYFKKIIRHIYCTSDKNYSFFLFWSQRQTMMQHCEITWNVNDTGYKPFFRMLAIPLLQDFYRIESYLWAKDLSYSEDSQRKKSRKHVVYLWHLPVNTRRYH